MPGELSADPKNTYASECVREPFTRPNDYILNSPEVFLGVGRPLMQGRPKLIIGAYINERRPSDVKQYMWRAPLTNASQLSEGIADDYRTQVTNAQNSFYEGAAPRNIVHTLKREVIDVTRQSGLRAVAAFVLFQSASGGHEAGLAIPRPVYNDMVARHPDLHTTDGLAGRMAGFYIGALHLPSIRDVQAALQ